MESQTHQQFVDDSILMGTSTVKEARGIKEGMDKFLEASGLEINKTKSQVYFFNIKRMNILIILGFLEGRLPSKYLGPLLAELTIRQVLWKDLLDKIKQKLIL